MLLIYDINSEILEGHEIKAPAGWDEDYIRNEIIRVQNQKKFVKSSDSVKEERLFSLEDFIRVIQEIGLDRISEGVVCGDYIYNSIKAL